MKNLIILFVLISTNIFAQDSYKMTAFKKVESSAKHVDVSKMMVGIVTYGPNEKIITKPSDIMSFDIGVSFVQYLIQDSKKHDYLSKNSPNVLFTKKGTILIFFSYIKNTWAVDFIPDYYYTKSGKNGMRCLTAIETKELVNLLME